MHILDLPVEIFHLVASFLHDIECLANTASTCRTLHEVFKDVNPNLILRLAAASSLPLFQPHPWFLLVFVAAPLSDWAMLSEENTERFREALREGADALLALSLSVCSVTMEDIRRMHEARLNIVNPLTDLVSELAEDRDRVHPSDPIEEASGVDLSKVSSERAGLQVIVYSELFKSTSRAILYPGSNLPKLPIEARLEYLRFCVTYDGDLMTRNTPPLIFCRSWQLRWFDLELTYPLPEDLRYTWRESMAICAWQAQGLDGMRALFPSAAAEHVGEMKEVQRAALSLSDSDKPRRYFVWIGDPSRKGGGWWLVNGGYLKVDVFDNPRLISDLAFCDGPQDQWKQSSTITLVEVESFE